MEKFTVGVEEEYMVVDPKTRELKSHDQLFDENEWDTSYFQLP